jgi:hypothetical protein
VARSSALLQALEVGTCRIAGHLPDYEAKSTAWQAVQHQPDALAALVVAFDILVHAAGQRVVIARPDLTARLVERLGGSAPRSDLGAGATVVAIPDWMRRCVDGRRAYDPCVVRVRPASRRRAP